MQDYKREVRITYVIFIVLVLTGGMLSSFFVLGKDAFFGPEPSFSPHTYVVGLPLHYFLLIVLSWIGATLLGVVWSIMLDRIDKREL